MHISERDDLIYCIIQHCVSIMSVFMLYMLLLQRGSYVLDRQCKWLNNAVYHQWILSYHADQFIEDSE